MAWIVYLARCRDGSLYTGITTDPDRRLREHNQGLGAAYTRSRLPVALVYSEVAGSRSQALRRELAIKSLTRAAKEALALQSG
jgi:putative endonuclease